ncbi:MAG: hypothetical protein FJZ97_01925 [Chloroflexi bacterium]|nr:hypothetical protein [Chloroflexota bacterium]
MDAERWPTRTAARAWIGGALLSVIGIAQRLVLWFAYTPVEYSDTGAYLRLGDVLASGSLRGYDGRRVPGYPAFTALAGGEASSIYALQLGLGVAISLLLFWMTYRATRSAGLGVVVGLLYDLIPGQFLFEANLLSETLAAFLVVLSMTLLGELLRAGGRRVDAVWALLLGISSAMPGLTRPEYYFLPVWFLPFIVTGSAGLRRAARRLAAYLPLPALLLGGWVAFIYSQYGMLSPTVVVGYGLVQHTGPYFEDLPDSAAPLRDAYVRLRDERVAARGNQTNTVWTAIPDLMEASELSFYDLSRELQHLSLQLIREHPDRFALSAAGGWVEFWKAPVYANLEAIDSAPARAGMQTWAAAGRALSLAVNGLFLAGSAALVVSRRLRRQLTIDPHMLAAAGTVWITSVVQTLFEHGDNPRFLAPTQMLVVYVVARWAYAWWMARRRPEAQAA